MNPPVQRRYPNKTGGKACPGPLFFMGCAVREGRWKSRKGCRFCLLLITEGRKEEIMNSFFHIFYIWNLLSCLLPRLWKALVISGVLNGQLTWLTLSKRSMNFVYASENYSELVSRKDSIFIKRLQEAMQRTPYRRVIPA
jgi:hypothetical protein